jgi:hypothetical protein
LPHFFTSDPDYDKFLNEYFMRHLTVDDHGVYSGWVKLGTVDHMWVIEWDMWMLPWIDRGAMGLKRQFGWTGDCIYSTLANVPVDKYGYTWGGTVTAEPNNGLGGYKPTFGWCWPKYNRNFTTPTPTGWEFNDIADNQRDKWAVKGIDLKPGYVDHCLEGTITGDHPELTSPAFDTDVYQVPIVELDITYSALRQIRRKIDRWLKNLLDNQRFTGVFGRQVRRHRLLRPPSCGLSRGVSAVYHRVQGEVCPLLPDVSASKVGPRGQAYHRA